MIVADDTRTDADSYVSVEYADSYFLSRNDSTWEKLEDIVKESALIKATDYIDNVFDWKGRRKSAEQSLAFPRIDLYSNDGYAVSGIPECLKKAVCEAASILVDGTDLYQTVNENGRVTSESIGQIHFTYDVSTLKEDKSLYESINYRLRGLFNDSDKKRIIFGEVTR